MSDIKEPSSQYENLSLTSSLSEGSHLISSMPVVTPDPVAISVLVSLCSAAVYCFHWNLTPDWEYGIRILLPMSCDPPSGKNGVWDLWISPQQIFTLTWSDFHWKMRSLCLPYNHFPVVVRFERLIDNSRASLWWKFTKETSIWSKIVFIYNLWLWHLIREVYISQGFPSLATLVLL